MTDSWPFPHRLGLEEEGTILLISEGEQVNWWLFSKVTRSMAVVHWRTLRSKLNCLYHQLDPFGVRSSTRCSTMVIGIITLCRLFPRSFGQSSAVPLPSSITNVVRLCWKVIATLFFPFSSHSLLVCSSPHSVSISQAVQFACLVKFHLSVNSILCASGLCSTTAH